MISKIHINKSITSNRIQVSFHNIVKLIILGTPSLEILFGGNSFWKYFLPLDKKFLLVKLVKCYLKYGVGGYLIRI